MLISDERVSVADLQKFLNHQMLNSAIVIEMVNTVVEMCVTWCKTKSKFQTFSKEINLK